MVRRWGPVIVRDPIKEAGERPPGTKRSKSPIRVATPV
jgi:hypothetical protein